MRARVMLALMGDPRDAVENARRAFVSAGAQASLRFALPERCRDAAGSWLHRDAHVNESQFVFFADRAELPEIIPLLSGKETHILLLQGAYAFTERWDEALLRRFASCGDPAALLTATMSAPASDHPPCAYLPAFAWGWDERGVKLGRGLPIKQSVSPVRTLAADPAFCLMPVGFLTHVHPTARTLSADAYIAGAAVYALDEPLVWAISPLPDRTHLLLDPPPQPGTTMYRFEQMAGFRQTLVKPAWGLFFPQDRYPQQLPNALLIRQTAAKLLGRLPLPQFVSAFVDLPDDRKPEAVYLLRFGFLQALQELPLMLFTGGRTERRLRSMCPNAWAYPDQAVLPRTLLHRGMTPRQHFLRSKWHLLARAAQMSPMQTHVAWLDMDSLPHPVCPQAIPDLRGLMDGRIHIATVNAIPDASFFVVPVSLLRLMLREVNAITQLDVEAKRSLDEVTMIERLVQKYPDLFCLHPMEKRRRLFLGCFEEELLDL